jgi:hypothetical protein
MHPHELLALTIVEADRRIAAGDLSPVELTQACLSRIEETEPKINAFITLLADQALAQAREAEERARRGERRGPLDGIPVAVKDLYETAGVRTTAASNILRDHVPERDSFAVARLKDAGAVLLGKLNMHEWAWGGTSIVSAFGPVRNPWDLERIAGGSSGGSAAGLAASQFLGSLGTDTGGSIRIPASLCGIVGLKPTFGRVSVRGVLPMAESLDHAGPMARCVEDVAIIYAKAWDIVVVPPGYGHITINSSNKTLKMANWVCSDFSSMYHPIKEHAGAAYYLLEKGYVPNPKYTKIPAIRYLKPAEASMLGLAKGEDMYNLISDLSKLDFLKNPHLYSAMFSKVLAK